MLRNAYTFVCTLFALVFLLGFQSASHATAVKASGGFFDTNNTSVALAINGSDVTNTGQVTLTTGAAHFFANIDSITANSTDIALHSTYTYAGVTTVITGTLHNTGTQWVVNLTVQVNGFTAASFLAPFKGNVTIR